MLGRYGMFLRQYAWELILERKSKEPAGRRRYEKRTLCAQPDGEHRAPGRSFSGRSMLRPYETACSMIWELQGLKPLLLDLVMSPLKGRPTKMAHKVESQRCSRLILGPRKEMASRVKTPSCAAAVRRGWRPALPKRLFQGGRDFF